MWSNVWSHQVHYLTHNIRPPVQLEKLSAASHMHVITGHYCSRHVISELPNYHMLHSISRCHVNIL